MHWLFIICCLGGIDCFPCNHLGLKADDIIQNIVVLRTERFKRRAELSHLSFDVYMDPSFMGLPNSPEIMSLIVNPALKFFEDALYLRSPVSLVNLGREGTSFYALGCEEVTRCGPVAIPSKHFGPKSGTPALGWLDSARGIYKWSERVIRTEVRAWRSALGTFQRKVHIVVTPTVLRFAREYFSCPQLEGVELENQGGVGVSLSHWEMRILGNELMTATYTNVFRLSNLTLAFLEDTGWYLPNYSLAEHLAWGSKRGCIFSTESCYSYMLNQLDKGADIAPFCLTPQDKHLGDLFVCTPDRRSFGYCNLVQVAPKSNATNSHPMYTYFGNTSHLNYKKVIPHDYFGKVDLADFCPFVQEVTWSGPNGVPSRSSYCGDNRSSKALTKQNNYNLEVYGPNSICLSIAPNWTLLGRKSTFYEVPVRGAGCYKYRCSHKEGGLVLELAGGLQVLCPAGVPSALVNISVCLREPALTVLGYFHCPECTFFCSTSVCFSRNSPKSPVARPFLKYGKTLSQSPILLQPCRGNALASAFDFTTFLLVTLNSIELCFQHDP
ncbi:Leishmanolysin-like peptidase [Taenia crassiceps]|uniref:Leishmanolysin-like peptidase n=1 Tax=Taenia crassiceps TaxID=6207 RepID=A0ABR4QSF8_9CEST